MTKRKYVSEFGLHMRSSRLCLLQEDYLKRIEDIIFPFHIYFICRRPRVSVDPGRFQFTDKEMSGRFIIHQGPTQIPFDFTCPNNGERGIVRGIKSEWPHTTLSLIDGEGAVIYHGKSALFAFSFSDSIRPHLHLDVMYIGQSYGEDGNRIAASRLQSHSTFQKILGEASRLAPDKEIWIVLSEWEEIILASFDGRSSSEFQTDMNQDTEHIHKITREKITEDQVINVTEAALIRYFQPEYNKHFRDNFPNKDHTVYSGLYELDFNSVSLELDCEPIGLRLYSGKSGTHWVHCVDFPLHEPADRKAMFDLLNP